jgi:hypothetical protein
MLILKKNKNNFFFKKTYFSIKNKKLNMKSSNPCEKKEPRLPSQEERAQKVPSR